jgi:hypothetical protein
MNLFALMVVLFSGAEQVRYFPSILFGHILVGSGTSRYETEFVITSANETRSTLDLFTDKGEPMKASFVDETGRTASIGSSFHFLLRADRPLTFKIALLPEETSDAVMVKTGWATFHSGEAIEVLEVVRITSPDGKLIDRHFMASETPSIGD